MTGREHAWLPAVVESLGRDRSVARGGYLFRQGDPTVGIYEVKQGRVRLSRLDLSGREISLHSAGPGEFLAEASLFSKVYHCDAIAVTDARARLYPKKQLLAALTRDAQAFEGFAARLAHELMAVRTRLELRNIRSAGSRIASHLALNTGADGRTIALQGSLKDLAAEIGLSHEAFYRALKKLETAGRIERTREAIILKKMSGI